MPVATSNDQIEVPLNKSKIILLLFIGATFVIGGVYFIIDPSKFTDSGLYHRPTIEILIVGDSCLVFFGAGVVFAIVKLFDKKSGLRIDDEGITINPGSSTLTIIEWGKIEKFDIIDISGTKIIGVYLKEPEAFINELNNAFKRKLAEFSLKRYGTPVSIATDALKCSSDELYELLTNRLKKVVNEYSN